MNALGDTLKKLREERKLSMDEMANELKRYGVSPSKSMISRWENGKAEPSMEYARILAKYYNVSLDYLLGIEDKNDDHPIQLLAAHAIDELTTEEQEKLIEYAKFLKSQRK